MMNSVGRERMVSFKILVNGHYYIGLVVHSFKDFISDWLEDVYVYYILLSRSINGSVKSLQCLSSLSIIYESDE